MFVALDLETARDWRKIQPSIPYRVFSLRVKRVHTLSDFFYLSRTDILLLRYVFSSTQSSSSGSFENKWTELFPINFSRWFFHHHKKHHLWTSVVLSCVGSSLIECERLVYVYVWGVGLEVMLIFGLCMCEESKERVVGCRYWKGYVHRWDGEVVWVCVCLE